MNYKRYIKIYNLKKDYLKDLENIKNLFNNKLITKKEYFNNFNLYINNINSIDKLLLDYKFFNTKAKKIRIN